MSKKTKNHKTSKSAVEQALKFKSALMNNYIMLVGNACMKKILNEQEYTDRVEQYLELGTFLQAKAVHCTLYFGARTMPEVYANRWHGTAKSSEVQNEANDFLEGNFMVNCAGPATQELDPEQISLTVAKIIATAWKEKHREFGWVDGVAWVKDEKVKGIAFYELPKNELLKAIEEGDGLVGSEYAKEDFV